MTVPDLGFRVRLIGSVTIELEGGVYSLEASSRSDQATPIRKHEVSSPYVEGTYTTAAVRDNVVENISVYVDGGTPDALYTSVRALRQQLARPSYKIEWDWWRNETGTSVYRETWTCFAAQVTVESTQPLMVARLALVRAQIPRLPEPTVAVVTA